MVIGPSERLVKIILKQSSGSTLFFQALMAMKDLMNRLGSELVTTEEAAPCSDLRFNYLLKLNWNLIDLNLQVQLPPQHWHRRGGGRRLCAAGWFQPQI